MVAKGLNLSSSKVEVFIEKRPTLEHGKISINLFNKKYGSSEVITMEYHRDQISFIFDLSELIPSQVSQYNFSISISDIDGTIVEEVKLRDSVGRIDKMLSGAVKKIIHDFIIVAKNINGSKVFIFKKMYSGENCSLCWDRDLDSSTDSNCKKCGGTGKTSRYSKPYTTYAGALQSSSNSKENMQEGMVSDYGPQTVSLPAVVELETDDIIYYQILGVWFIVNSSLSVASLKTIDSLQTVAISELPSHSPQVETLSKNKDFILSNKGR